MYILLHDIRHNLLHPFNSISDVNYNKPNKNIKQKYAIKEHAGYPASC